VEEGYAVKVAHGTYRLAALGATGSRVHPHLLKHEVHVDPRRLVVTYPI